MQLSEALQTYFGFQAFRPGQEKVVETLVAGQSALAIFPTGAGKSLCYQLPALLLPHLTLVVSPLLALMKDQIDFLQNRGIAAARLDSSLSRDDYDQILMQARQGELKILMISVERFKNERFRAQLQRLKISLLVVDEAHCISEWGHNFRPEYLKLPHYRQEFKIPQTLLLTATATPQVRADICRKFEIPAEQITLTGFYRANLNLTLTAAPESEKMQLLINRIQEAPQAPTIVYVTLQKTAETVAQNLAEAGFQAQAYHAGLPHDERERIQNAFLAGNCPCVVATIAFGMGIDKADIRRVIHYDLPKSLENYSQEVGRAGRDGAPAHCEVLANRESVPVLENFIYGETPEPKAIESLLKQLQTHPEPLWELKLRSLSQELDIRELPLKTLLVYLDLHGILRPKYTRFEDYSLKFIRPQSEIVSRFQGERQAFVNSLFAHSETKRVWTRVQVEPFLSQYPGADRQRVVTALEYFAEKGWIELEAKQAVETYQILSRDFDPPALTKTISDLFRAKEAQEMGRIAQMLAFFGAADCLSRQLAAYFGEDLKQACGHCSVCQTGPIELPEPADQILPDTQILAEMTAEAAQKLGLQDSVSQRTKFLCGIATPLSSRLKLKQLPHFGALESLPYAQVRERIARLFES